MAMVSEATMERTLLDELGGVILEDLSGELPIEKIWNETSIGLECGDEIFPALAWVKNIG
jgi:hypothetical protein